MILHNRFCYARYDSYPVGKGHLLIIPFRHVADFFELTEDERKAAFELVALHGVVWVNVDGKCEL